MKIVKLNKLNVIFNILTLQLFPTIKALTRKQALKMYQFLVYQTFSVFTLYSIFL